jgi:hypothetical protein
MGRCPGGREVKGVRGGGGGFGGVEGEGESGRMLAPFGQRLLMAAGISSGERVIDMAVA